MRTYLVQVGIVGACLALFLLSTVQVHAFAEDRSRDTASAAGSESSGQAGEPVRANYDFNIKSDSDSRFHDGSFVYVPKATPEPETDLFYGGSFQMKVPSDSSIVGQPGANAAQVAETGVGSSITVEGKATLPAPAGFEALPRQSAEYLDVPAATSAGTLSKDVMSTVTFPHDGIPSEPETNQSRQAPASPHGEESSPTSVPVLSIAPAVEDAQFYGESFVLDTTTNRLQPARPGSRNGGTQFLNMPVRAPTINADEPTASTLPQSLAPGVSTIPDQTATTEEETVVQSVGGPGVEGLLPTYHERSVLPITGKAMYYNPGIMQYVLDYRLNVAQVEQCPECIGYAALLRAGDLNRRIWIQWPETGLEGPYLVIDVAARHHVNMLLSRGWVVDVDYRTAMRHGMNRPITVTVYGQTSTSSEFTSVSMSE